MSTQFDVSFGYMDSLSPEILAQQQESVEHLAGRPNALANAKLHAANELNRLVGVCNRAVWGAPPADMRKPEAAEMAALLQSLSAEACDALLKNCRLAAEQRSLVARIEHAEKQALERLAAEEAETEAREAETREAAEFEAFDAAGREARFHAWRAGRGQI